MRKLYINAILEVMEEEFGDELHNKLTKKIDEKIRNKRSKLGLETLNWLIHQKQASAQG